MMQHEAHAERDHIRWALLGTGEFAVDWIAPALKRAANCKLVAVVSRSLERASDVAAKLDVALAYACIDDIDVNEVTRDCQCLPSHHVICSPG